MKLALSPYLSRESSNFNEVLNAYLYSLNNVICIKFCTATTTGIDKMEAVEPITTEHSHLMDSYM